MAILSAAEAQSYVKQLQLPVPPASAYEAETPPAPSFNFTEIKDQAMVVGADIVAFLQGVTAERRQDLSNSALLAQLAADKLVPDSNDLLGWYSKYFEILTNTGWVIQEKDLTEYEEKGDVLEVNKAVLEVAGKLLDAKSLALVKTTLEKLEGDQGPWITLFKRRSQYGRTARFRITLTEQGTDDEFLVALMAFGLEAQSDITQVLFTKFSSSSVHLKHRSGKVTLNPDVVNSVRPLVSAKISSHISN
jgi:hypothetical protein